MDLWNQHQMSAHCAANVSVGKEGIRSHLISQFNKMHKYRNAYTLCEVNCFKHTSDPPPCWGLTLVTFHTRLHIVSLQRFMETWHSYSAQLMHTYSSLWYSFLNHAHTHHPKTLLTSYYLPEMQITHLHSAPSLTLMSHYLRFLHYSYISTPFSLSLC